MASLRPPSSSATLLTRRDVERLAASWRRPPASTSTARPRPSAPSATTSCRGGGRAGAPAARCSRWAAAWRTCSSWCSTAPGGLAGVGEVGRSSSRSPHLARGYLGDAGADRGARPARSVRPAGRPHVPHRRPGPLPAGRRRRVPRPRRPPGQDPRLPHRARRGRGGARRATRACTRRAVVAREDGRATAARRLRRAAAEPRRRCGSWRASCASGARLHGARRLRRLRPCR